MQANNSDVNAYAPYFLLSIELTSHNKQYQKTALTIFALTFGSGKIETFFSSGGDRVVSDQASPIFIAIVTTTIWVI